jgi:hypothetical protein
MPMTDLKRMSQQLFRTCFPSMLCDAIPIITARAKERGTKGIRMEGEREREREREKKRIRSKRHKKEEETYET